METIGGGMIGASFSTTQQWLLALLMWGYPAYCVWSGRPMARWAGIVIGSVGVLGALLTISAATQTIFGVQMFRPSIGPYVFMGGSALILGSAFAEW
jgi:hypothetical protein